MSKVEDGQVSEEAVGETKWEALPPNASHPEHWTVIRKGVLPRREFQVRYHYQADELVEDLTALEEELKQLRAGLQESNGMWRLSTDRAHVQSLWMDEWANEPLTNLVKALREYHADRAKAWKENEQLRAKAGLTDELSAALEVMLLACPVREGGSAHRQAQEAIAHRDAIKAQEQS